MSCGNKKLTQETGVHLTERTCSPYNPIIRLMIDNCLGLPVYPVTSLDAVIDEEGNTLRKILEDFISSVNDKNVDVNEAISEVQDVLSEFVASYYTSLYISQHFLTKEEAEGKYIELSDFNPEEFAEKDNFNELKKLVDAIAGITTIGDPNPATLASDGQTPTIVKAINNLQALVGSSSDSSGDTWDDKNLSERIDMLHAVQEALKEVIISLANYNEDYDPSINSMTNRLQLEEENGKLVLLAKVILMKSTLDNLNSILNTEGTGLVAKVSELEKLKLRVDNLDKNSAHLDPTVLNQMPENAERPEIYQTLKVGEYPPTLLDFIQDGSTFRTGKERLEYYGLLTNIIEVDWTLINDGSRQYAVYPLGHTDENMGLPLYTKVDGSYVGLKNADNQNLRAGKNYIDINDLNFLERLCLPNEADKSAIFVSSPTIENLKYSDLYIKVQGAYYLIGDVNKDNILNVIDLNAIILKRFDLVQDGTPQNSTPSNPSVTLPSTYTKDTQKGTIHYYDKYNKLLAIYPCVEGKIYLDYFTNNLFCYSNGEMHLLPSVLDKAHIESYPNEGLGLDNPKVTLKGTEYPPEVLEFVTSLNSRSPGFKYFGELRLAENYIYASVLPFAYRKDSEYYKEGYSYQLYYLKNGDPLNPELAPLLDIDSLPLYAGSGTITAEDVNAISTLVYQRLYPKPVSEIVNLPENPQIYFKAGSYNCRYCKDIKGIPDSTFGVGTVTTTIDFVLGLLYGAYVLTNASTGISLNILELYPLKDWIYYFENDSQNSCQLVSFYPCIENKIYVDSGTNKTYIYKNGKMHVININSEDLTDLEEAASELLDTLVVIDRRINELSATLDGTSTALELATYRLGGMGDQQAMYDHIDSKYINVPFLWLLLDNGNYDFVQFVPNPGIVPSDIGSANENTSVGTVVDLTTGTSTTVNYYVEPNHFGPVENTQNP